MNTNNIEYLYRGIHIPYYQFDEVILNGEDLLPPNLPTINDNGEKTVLDGNEYGIYMTDNERMVNDVYGNVHSNGTIIINTPIGNSQRFIAVPDVGITYKIKTDGINIRKPKITPILQGHYNNGFIGDEYITDIIPKDNYEVTRIRIGKDILHDEEDIINTNIEEAKQKTKEIIELRKYRLDTLANEIIKMTDFEIRNIDFKQLEILKDMYGSNGVKYKNTIDTSNSYGQIEYLYKTLYEQNNETIKFSELEYVLSLKKRINDENNLKHLINEDILNNELKKEVFIEKKQIENIIANTNSFDNKHNLMNKTLTILNNIPSNDLDNQKTK